MIIPIDSEWQITTDEYQWIAQKVHIPESGKQAGERLWKNKTYHTTLDSAIKSLGQSMIRNSNTDTLLGALETFKNVNSKLSLALDSRMGVSV